LVDSIYGNGRLVCPLHSYSFDVKTGACDNPDIGVLKIYTIEVRGGRVLVKA
jgi:nitrite reductase/ring-hydroxylating ferredoxin subunit